TNTSNFNQVFFDDVRIPGHRRLGDAGRGWQVAMSALAAERFSIAGTSWPIQDVLQLLDAARAAQGAGRLADSALREQIADIYVRASGAGNTIYRLMTAISRGEEPGPAASALKLVNATMLQEIASLGVDLMGEAGILLQSG